MYVPQINPSVLSNQFPNTLISSVVARIINAVLHVRTTFTGATDRRNISNAKPSPHKLSKPPLGFVYGNNRGSTLCCSNLPPRLVYGVIESKKKGLGCHAPVYYSHDGSIMGSTLSFLTPYYLCLYNKVLYHPLNSYMIIAGDQGCDMYHILCGVATHMRSFVRSFAAGIHNSECI